MENKNKWQCSESITTGSTRVQSSMGIPLTDSEIFVDVQPRRRPVFVLDSRTSESTPRNFSLKWSVK
jgi:hypothetical protein